EESECVRERRTLVFDPFSQSTNHERNTGMGMRLTLNQRASSTTYTKSTEWRNSTEVFVTSRRWGVIAHTWGVTAHVRGMTPHRSRIIEDYRWKNTISRQDRVSDNQHLPFSAQRNESHFQFVVDSPAVFIGRNLQFLAGGE